MPMSAVAEAAVGIQAYQAGAAAIAAIVGGAAFTLKKISGGSTATESVAQQIDTKPGTVDLSIPYDAAAILAYDEWLSVGGKEDGAATFSSFKNLYISKVVADVTLKKCERDLAILKNGKAEDNVGSVRYDAAARLAYDEWRNANNKGEFDEEGFAAFKPIYNAKSSAEASAKKVEREMASL